MRNLKEDDISAGLIKYAAKVVIHTTHFTKTMVMQIQKCVTIVCLMQYLNPESAVDFVMRGKSENLCA
jgi:hypothetical protein